MNAAPSSTPASARRGLGDLVTEVFRQWHAAQIRFVVLRNYENLPQETGNDIDVLVSPGQMGRAESVLISAATHAGYRLHNRAEFSPISLFFFHPESQRQIQFDLFPNLAWRGLELIASAGVLERCEPRGDFFIPAPDDETVINLLTRLIYHGYVKEKYRPAIVARLTTGAEAVSRRLSEKFGARLARDIVAAATAGDWDGVGWCSKAMRRQLVWRGAFLHPFRTLGALLGDGIRLTGRFIHPPGITVVLVGADGCGKSTVAEKLVEALRGTFHANKSLRVHWKPAVFLRKRRSGRLPTTDPHGKPPRGKLLSVLLLGYHWLEFFAGYWLQLRPVLFRNGLVLVDRYHYDFVVDPLRFRLSSLPGLARGLFRLLPTPDLVFLLDAPPGVLQTRKREVAIAETARQREAYRSEIGRLPNAHIVDASQPAEAVAGEVIRRTLAYMATRQAARGNTDET
jgi:thymidylate kinase